MGATSVPNGFFDRFQQKLFHFIVSVLLVRYDER